MHGKVVVMTGGTSGIGQVAAEALAGLGARLVLIARDPVRADHALQRLKAIAPGVRHSVRQADLSSIAETRRVGAEIAAEERRIDVLINNAGAIFGQRHTSPDGLEMSFALNHMAYFVLTQTLLKRLGATQGARVVSTASDAHKAGRLDFDDLQAERRYSPFAAYGASKLCNILFTRELARRLGGTSVTANCLHPGFVATRFGDRSGGLVQALMPLAMVFAISPQKGADTLTYLASSSEVEGVTGRYFYKRRPVEPSAAARDDDAAARLWAASEAIAARVK